MVQRRLKIKWLKFCHSLHGPMKTPNEYGSIKKGHYCYLYKNEYEILCDVVHNKDGILKIASPVFCFLVDNPASGR